MSQSVQAHCHGSADLIEQGGIAVPESMEATLRDAQLFEQRMKLPLANQAVIPRRTVSRREQQAQRVWASRPEIGKSEIICESITWLTSDFCESTPCAAS